jgi:hypothetical protein
VYDSYVMTHNGRRWEIKLRREQWFAHDNLGGCVGPYSTLLNGYVQFAPNLRR